MAISYDKKPSFRDQSPTSVINEVSARLVVFPQWDQAFQSGSCCRVSKNLYVTAAHVVRDWLHKFGTNTEQQTFEIWAIHVRGGPKYSVWIVDRIWINPISDLAILHTHPYNDVAGAETSVTCVAMNVIPPKIGQRIVGFGHHSPDQKISIGEDGTRHIEINGFGAATVGEVKEVHHEKRDSVRLPFPCFQVNARFDGGMSGGPVFNDQGQLCGVICSNLPPPNQDDEHVSYATMLWPLMATYINIALDGTEVDQSYALINLARQGVLTAIGHESVRIQGNIGMENFRVEIDKY